MARRLRKRGAYPSARGFDHQQPGRPAAERFRRTSELNPGHPLIRHNLGELHLARGRFEEAIPELESVAELSARLSGVPSSHYLAILGCAYVRAQRRTDALEILEELDRRHRRGR